MIVRLIDGAVMLIGGFLIGWHLVTPPVAAPVPKQVTAAEVPGQAARETIPKRVAECEEQTSPARTEAPLPAADPDRLPDDYLSVLGLPTRRTAR